ncbi:MAG TPA: hypothetical protein VF082_11840 [Jiangellaceae bacterium]
MTDPTQDQPPADDSGLSTAEREELTRLRAEVEQRNARTGRRREVGWRSIVSALAITLGCILAPVAVVSAWLQSVVVDTDRYVETMAPLADDPAVQSVVADAVSNQILTSIDVEALVDQTLGTLADVGAERGLPERATERIEGLAGPIASGIEGFVSDRVDRFVASDRFADIWETVNRESHAQLNAALTGESAAVQIESGEVTIQLAPIIDRVKERLADDGLGLISRVPTVDAVITVYSGGDVSTMQRAFNAIDRAGVVLPIIAIALIVAGVLLARDRRRATIRAGVGLAVAMVVLAVAILIGRNLYLDSVDDVIPYEAATAIFDQVVSFLRLTLRAVLAAGLVVALWAALSGPSAAAVGMRSAVTGAFRRWRGAADSRGWRLGGVGEWVHAHRRILRIGVLVLAALALVFWPYPTGTVVLVLAALALLAVGIIEFLGTAPGEDAEPPAAVPG